MSDDVNAMSLETDSENKPIMIASEDINDEDVDDVKSKILFMTISEEVNDTPHATVRE